MFIEEIDISSLLKAFGKFESFRQHLKSEQERSGAIQAFEYCFELSWKTMKRLLDLRGVIVNSPRETLRQAMLEGFIEDAEIWFDFLKMRNLTVHTYEENEANKVVAIFSSFSAEVKKFLFRIGVKDAFH